MVQYLKERFDTPTALITLALCILGIVSVYSATYDAHASEIFHKQILWVVVGATAFLVMTFLPFRFLSWAHSGFFIS